MTWFKFKKKTTLKEVATLVIAGRHSLRGSIPRSGNNFVPQLNYPKNYTSVAGFELPNYQITKVRDK
jgi:hypothetical protein